MNKKIIAVFSAVSIIVISLIIVGSNFEKSSTTSNNISDDTVIVIDSGHGGEDGGAVSQSGVIESELNLKYSNKLNDIMHLNGFRTVMTHKDNTDLGDKNLPTISARKKSDMKKRLEIYNSDVHNIAISIHQNIFPAVSCKGSQLFYSLKNPNSKQLADSITSSIINNLQKDNMRISKPTNGSIFLLDNAIVPAIIVECGFLSSEDEVKKLCDTNYQKQLSYCIFDGFLKSEII